LAVLRLSWMAALLGFFLDSAPECQARRGTWLLVLFFAQCALSAYFAYLRSTPSTNHVIACGDDLLPDHRLVTTERRLYLFVGVYLLST